MTGTGHVARKPQVGALIPGLLLKVVAVIFKFCFGWIGWILEVIGERQLKAKVRSELYFLFEEFDARFVPYKSRHAEAVLVEFGVVRLTVSLHHGETYFAVASIFAPEDWNTFPLIVKGIADWDSNRFSDTTDLSEFAPMLREAIPFLQDAFSESNVRRTLTNAIHRHNRGLEEYAETARANGIEPIILPEGKAMNPNSRTP